MKILHIIDSGGLYGAEMVLLNLVAEQTKLGLDAAIASIGEKGIKEKPLEKEALKRGIEVIKFRMRPGPNLLGAWKILRFAHKERFDLLHSHGYKGNILFGLMPKKFRQLPLVATLHGWTSTKPLTKMRMYEWLDALSLRFIDAVVLVSKVMLSNPKLRRINRANLFTVNNGIPISENRSPSHHPNFSTSGRLPQQARATRQTPLTQEPVGSLDKTIFDFCNKGFTIGSIGRLSREKGYRFLIEAIKLLLDDGIDAHLVIFGEGYGRVFLEGLVARFQLSSRVMLPGYRDKAKNYLPYFDVFAISSLTEGLPITLLEAMQANMPIVATKVGGIPDALGNGRSGLLVEPASSKSFAQAIRRLYHDPKLAKDLASVSYQEVITKYTSKTMALGYLDIYQKLIQENQSRVTHRSR